MSADNEICILELTDAQGDKEYRVADNVSMSYNTLQPDIDHTDKNQMIMVYRIWEDAKEFYHSLDVSEYANKLEDGNYYEYGITQFKINIDWEDVIKFYKKHACSMCGGTGEFECFQNAWGEHGSNCPDCKGTGIA